MSTTATRHVNESDERCSCDSVRQTMKILSYFPTVMCRFPATLLT